MSFEHVFNEMEILADPFALCELQGQCSLGLGSQLDATLHYILAGSGELVFPGKPAIQIERGTLVLVPTVQPHTLRSFGKSGHPLPDCHPAELDLASHLLNEPGSAGAPGSGGDGKLLAICSHVSIGLRGTNGLIDLIREPIVEALSGDDPMTGPIDLLLLELSAPTLGSKAMIRAALLQCIIHLMRRRLQAQDQALSWMAALVDERLWKALQNMLEAPGDPHTVESLANTAAISRSTFAARFSAAYGRGPMELLRELRMHRAASFLCQSDIPVKRIAELVGFHSRSAFSRTFSGTIGMSPSQYRANCKG